MLAVFAVDIATGKDVDPLPVLLTTSNALSNAAAKVLASGEYKATLGETLLLHGPSGLKAERLLVVGLGKAKELSVDEVRKGAGTAVRAAKPLGVRAKKLVEDVELERGSILFNVMAVLLKFSYCVVLGDSQPR